MKIGTLDELAQGIQMPYNDFIHTETLMKKPYLLIAGDNRVLLAGSGDWIACYETLEEANIVKDDFARNRDYDWYEIVDLREWAE